MATKTELINELESRHGTSPETRELRRRFGNTLYQNIPNSEDVSKVANTVFDMSTEFGVPIPVVESHYDENSDTLLKRGGKKFANRFVLNLIEESRPSSNLVEAFSIGNQVVDAIEKTGGLKEVDEDAPFFKREGRKFLNAVRIVWEMNKAYFSPKKQQVTKQAVKGLGGLRQPVSFDVPPPETRGEKIVDVTAGLGAFVAQILVLNKILPPETFLSDAVAFEMLNRADGGIPGKGAAVAGALGAIGKIPATSIVAKLGRLTAQGGLFAGITAAEGGSPEDIAIAALAPFALKAVGGAKSIVGEAAVGKFFKAKFPNLKIFTNAEIVKAKRAASDWIKVKKGKITREQWSEKHGKFAVDFARRQAAAEQAEAVPEKALAAPKPVTAPAKPPAVAPVAKPPAEAITTTKPPVKPVVAKKAVGGESIEKGISLARAEQLTGQKIPTAFEIRQSFGKMDRAEQIGVIKNVKAELQELQDDKKSLLGQRKEAFTPDKPLFTQKIKDVGKRIVGKQAQLERLEQTPKAVEGGVVAKLDIPTFKEWQKILNPLTNETNEEFFGTLEKQRDAYKFKVQDLQAKAAGTFFHKPTPPPPQEPRLPGGREAGATTIIPDVTTEISETSKKLGSTVKSVVDAGKKLYSRNVLRYATDLRRLGDVGEEIANDFDEITQRAQVRINNSSADSSVIFKGVKKANRERIARTVNEIEKNPPKWIRDRAEVFRDVLDEILKEAKKLGVQRLVKGIKLDVTGTGKAFPQIPNADGEKFLKLADAQGLGSSVVLDAAERAVAAGKVATVEEYVTQLKEFRRAQLRGISGYLERTRVQLPEEFVEWDPDRILSGLFQTNWTFLEGARQWGIDAKGQSFPKLDVKIEGSPDFTGDDKQILERFIKAAFGQELLSSESARTISATVRGYQFLTKIAPSPLTILRNMMDRFAKVSAWSPLSVQAKTFIQYPPFINSWFKHSRELEEEMIRRGAVFSNAAIAEGYQPGKLFTTLAAKPFTSSELGNQVYIALAKRNAIDANLKILKQNSKIAAFFDKRMGKFLSPLEAIGKAPSQAAARLRELGNDELLAKLTSSKDISPDLLNAILHRTVRDNAFPVVLSTKRVWWDNHPFMRVLTQFKIWGTEQIGHIWNDVIKKTVQNRDPSLMIRWLTTMAVMGEIYNIIRDFALNKNESLLKNLSEKDRRNVRDISKIILRDIVDGGGVGIFADLMYGLPNLIGGPTAATIKNALTKTGESILNPSQFLDATKEEFFKESPALNQARGILDKIDAQKNRDNLTQDYSKVRSRAYEWRFNKEHPGQTDKVKALAIKALFGWVKRVPSPRSLALEMMNRQVLVGDIEDASEHIFFLFKQGGTDDEKFVSTSEAIRTSFNNNSPLGPVAERDLDEFFSSMDSKQRREAVKLQARWERNAAEATQKGIEKWEKWIRTQ